MLLCSSEVGERTGSAQTFSDTPETTYRELAYEVRKPNFGNKAIKQYISAIWKLNYLEAPLSEAPAISNPAVSKVENETTG